MGVRFKTAAASGGAPLQDSVLSLMIAGMDVGVEAQVLSMGAGG